MVLDYNGFQVRIHNLPLNRKSVFLTRHGAWVQPPYMAHSNMKIMTNPNSWHRKACQFAPVKGVLQLHPKTPTLHHKALLLFFHALWNHKQVPIYHNTWASPAFSKSSGYILPDIHLWVIIWPRGIRWKGQKQPSVTRSFPLELPHRIQPCLFSC